MAETDTVREFRIGRQPLEDALIEFAELLDAVFVAPGSVFDGMMANSVQGKMKPQEALYRLLAGTGFDGEISIDPVRTLKVFVAQDQNLAKEIEGGSDMNITKSRLSRVLTGLAALFTAVASASAIAQSDVPSGELEEVVVTGSRIKRQDYTANSPIMTVDQTTFENTSTIGIETVLNQMPQFVPAMTEFDSATLSSTATQTPGASIINLRGLGSFRTLTLIDGRRAQPLNATLAVDTNSIPSSALERVEIISGGASAVYGADAVAGVVNFILKDDYEGMEVSGRWGTTGEGDGEQLQFSALIGANFADDRGNVMLGVEHARRYDAYDTNRKWVEDELSDPFIRGTVIAETYVDFARGASRANQPDQAVIDAIFDAQPTCTLPGNGNPCPTPAPNNRFFVNRTPDGTGTVFTGGQAFGLELGHTGVYRYTGPLDDPDTGLPYRKITADSLLEENNLDALTTVPLERFSLFGKAEYEFTNNISAYLRGSFAHIETDTLGGYNLAVNNWSGFIPVGFEGTVWADSLETDGVTTKNAYQVGGAYGLNCPATGGCTESQAFPLPPELEMLLRSRGDQNQDIEIQRVMDYLPRNQTHNRNTSFQITAGLEGELPNTWTWDASVTYGQTEGITLTEGVADLGQYQDLLASPNYGVNFSRRGPSPTSSGTGICTTGLPIFRDFIPSQDCIDTVSVDMQTSSTLKQTIVEANLVGDLGQFFELPAGPVSFAIGADYREYEYLYINDNINSVSTYYDQLIGLFAQANTKDANLDTKEFYGELLIPIVKDLPLVNEFNLELGGRFSDWNTSGGVGTYKILGDWTVVPWARLRGGFNRATRSPHIAEFFQGRTISSQRITGDPCSQNDALLSYSANLNNNPNAAQVVALCRNLMTPVAASVFYGPVNTQPDGLSPPLVPTVFRSGNKDVQPETANTITIGGVLNSPIDNPWLSGLDLTIDYYSIEIDGIIALETADEVWRQCVISNDPNSPECALVYRDPFDGRLSLPILTFTNRGELKFSGVDIQLNWRAWFADLGLDIIPGGLAINSQFTIPIDRTTQDGPDAPVHDWVGTNGCELNVACSGYDYQVFSTFNYFYGPLSVSLRWNHYPTIEDDAYATDPDTRFRGVFESYDVFSLTGSYSFTDMITVRAGIDNIFDQEPPLSGGDYAADGGFVNEMNPPDLPSPARYSTDARYDQLGRRFFVGLNFSF